MSNWYPYNKLYSVNNFSDHNTGVNIYSDFNAQNDIGGVVSLRNIAAGLNVTIPAGEPWPSIIWSGAWNFSQIWSSISGDWTGSTPIQNLAYGSIAFVGQSSIYNTGSGTAQNGVVIESSAIITTLTGSVSEGHNQYGVLINHTGYGYDSVTVNLDPPGFIVGLGLTHETFVPSENIQSKLVGFRYGYKNTTGHFITTDGYSAYITNRETGNQIASLTGHNTKYVIGDITLSGNVDANSRVEFGNFKIKYNVDDIAGDFINDTEYSTSYVTFTGELFKLNKNLYSSAKYAYAELSGLTGNGTTIVHIATSTNSGSSYTLNLIYSGSNTGIYSGSIDVGKLSQDLYIRPVIKQKSADGTKPAPAVDNITLTFNYKDGTDYLSIYPDYGPAEGNTTSILHLDINDPSIVQFQTKDLELYGIFTGAVTGYYTGLFATGICTGAIAGPISPFGINSSTLSIATTDLPVYQDIFRKSIGSVQIGNSELLSTTGYTLLYSGLTGIATGQLGYVLSKYSNGALLTGGIYNQDVIVYPESDGIYSYAAQSFNGPCGNGFSLPTITGSSSCYLEMIVHVKENAVKINAGSTSILLSDINCKQPTKIRTLFSYNNSLNIFGSTRDGTTSTENSNFTIAGLKLKNTTGASVFKASNTFSNGESFTGNWYVESWIYNYGPSEGHYLSLANESDLAYINFGIDSSNNPFIENFDDTSTYTEYQEISQTSLNLNEWNHLAWVKSGSTIYLYQNGILTDVFAGISNIGIPNQVDTLYIHDSDINPIATIGIHTTEIPYNFHEISNFRALQKTLRFRSNYQFPESGAYFLYRFDKGTLYDAGLSGNHLLITNSDLNQLKIIRDIPGVHANAIQLNDGAFLESINAIAYTGTHMQIAGNIAYQSVFNDSTKIATGSNWSLYIENNKVCFSLGSKILTGSYELNTFQFLPIVVDLGLNGSNVQITGYYDLGSGPQVMFTGQSASSLALSGCVDFGNRTDNKSILYIDDFGLWDANVINLTGYMNPTTIKNYPNETIYFNGTAIPTGNIRHIGPYDKEFIVPTLSDYSFTGAIATVSVDTLAGNVSAGNVYKYSANRKIKISTGHVGLWEETVSKICKTKSPFRIGNVVPDGSINLSYIQGPDFSVNQNLSLIDNAPFIQDNVFSNLDDYYLSSALTGDNATGSNYTYIYTGEIDTDEIIVSTYTTHRKDIDIQYPLFYSHKLGNESLYLYQQGLSTGVITGSVIDVIRSNIRIIDDAGQNLDINTYPWDIRISNKRDDGTTLPNYIYNVELLTRDRYVPNKTLFVIYNAADPSNNWTEVKSYTECINSSPIYRKVETDNGTPETYIITEDPRLIDLSSTIDVGPTIKINITSGEWDPTWRRFIYG